MSIYANHAKQQLDAGKLALGMGDVYDQKLMDKYTGYGMRFILSGGDLIFLLAGGKARTEFLRNVKW
jgi:hypothetical protein